MKASEILRSAIHETSLSINGLALSCDVSQPSLSRFVSGEREISLSVFDKMVERLGLSLTEKVNWQHYVEKNWPEVEGELWNHYKSEHWGKIETELLDGYIKDHLENEKEQLWNDALASGDWQHHQYDAWYEKTYNALLIELDEAPQYNQFIQTRYQQWATDTYANWSDKARVDWEQQEKRRLKQLGWVQIVES